MADESTESIHVLIVRVDGKLDAYAAGQTARIDGLAATVHEHTMTLAEHGRQLGEHAQAIATAAATAPPPAHRTSGWTVASVIIAGVVALGSTLGLIITLIQIIPHVTP
ncbi:MAG: hypothetical protein FWF90_11350 [Promicromonosporaceae bacterium]|nr:hypothetical protein [Promicromonosporaceae bacterium]